MAAGPELRKVLTQYIMSSDIFKLENTADKIIEYGFKNAESRNQRIVESQLNEACDFKPGSKHNNLVNALAKEIDNKKTKTMEGSDSMKKVKKLNQPPEAGKAKNMKLH